MVWSDPGYLGGLLGLLAFNLFGWIPVWLALPFLACAAWYVASKIQDEEINNERRGDKPW